MSNQTSDEQVHEKLARAVISGLLPDRAHEQAEKLLTRLETPVRLALLGLPKSGKSTILNLLVGADVLPEGLALPTLQLVYGRREQAICTLSDGSQTTMETVDLAQVAAQSPAFVELRLPLAALKKISVLEVVAPSDVNALHRASQWAAKRCDIALWCTGGFMGDEQRVWSQMPDSIKDHALLMMTRRDILDQQGTFDDVHSAVLAVATGEFNKILPISTRDAIAARADDGTVDKAMLRASGGMALISAVLKQVDQGRRSALDLAELLLIQNEDALVDLDSVLSAAEDEDYSPQEDHAPEEETFVDDAEDADDEPASEIAAEDVEEGDAEALEISSSVTFEQHPNPTMSPLRRRDAAPAPRLDAPEAERVSVGIARLRDIATRRAEEGMQPPPVVELQPATRDAYKQAIGYLQEKAGALADQLESLGDEAPAAITEQAVEDMNWLCDYLNQNGDDGDVALQRARDTAFDAADLVQLMQMERRDSAAIEAVSLMLQVKRELEADLAA